MTGLRRPGGVLLMSAVALTVSGCPPDVDTIEIVPRRVELGAPGIGTTFELEARLWEKSGADRRSIIPSDGHKPHWTNLPTWLELVSQSDFKAVFRVKQTPPTSGTLKVEADGKASSASILVPPNPVVPDDHLSGGYTPARPPEVGIVSGDWLSSGNPCVTVHAFVQQAMLGERVKPCEAETSGWSAVMSQDHSVSVTPVSWTTPPGNDNASPTQQPILVLPVALRIMAYDPFPTDPAKLRDTVLKNAKMDLGLANVVLAEARAGIRLELNPAHITTGTLTYHFVVKSCADADGTADDEPGVLTIYYVDELNTDRAVTCHWHEGRPQESIYVDRHKRVSGTLVHEIGHALGLTLPRDGHTEVMKEFDLTNVMMCCNVDKDRLARTRLTVGQVFRMNTDSGSWLNWAKVGSAYVRQGPRKQCQCGAQDPDGICPRLAEDVAAPNTTVTGVYPRDCFDRLRISGPPLGSETPVAIVAGRRWRMPPATPSDKSNCRWDLAGQSETQFGAVAVRFDNLTRPGSCASWAVIYFRHHGLMPIELKDADIHWTQVGEERQIPGPPPNAAPVTVTLRYHDNDLATVAADRNHLSETFGELNHAGIALTFVDVKVPNGSPLPCPAGSGTGFNLCYQTSVTTEGIADPTNQKAELGVNYHKTTTASHFLARLLGLDPLTPSEVAAHPDEYDRNLMHGAAATRGNRLTLGQVYRMHAALKLVPVCPAGSDKCPPLYADVPP